MDGAEIETFTSELSIFGEKEKNFEKKENVIVEKDCEDYFKSKEEVDYIIENVKSVLPSNSTFLNFFGSFMGNLLGNIPGVGPLAGAVFSTLWDEAFIVDGGQPGMPPQPRFLTVDEFNNFQEQFRRDMERQLNQRVDAIILSTATAYLIDLKNACDNYHLSITWFEEHHGQGRHRSSIPNSQLASYLKKPLLPGTQQFNSFSLPQIKEEIRRRHGTAFFEMKRCLDYFLVVGNAVTAQRQLMFGNVIQVCMYFILMQRDIQWKGLTWGFLPNVIRGVPLEISRFIDNSFYAFAPNALPPILNSPANLLNRFATPDLFNIYSTFAYLDLLRFPIASIKLDIGTNHVLVIPREFDDNRIQIVVNQFNCRRDNPQSPASVPNWLVEGVYNCDDFWATNISYSISRPTRPFTNINIRFSTTGWSDTNRVRILLDHSRVHHTNTPCKDIYFYSWQRWSSYMIVSMQFPQPRTLVELRLENIQPHMSCNHSIVTFS